MIVAAQTLPDSLRAGRRIIDSIPNVELLSDLAWFEQPQAWGLSCRIRINTVDPALVPRETDWWILLDSRYPYGRIKFLPAKVGGISKTFPHQSRNVAGEKALPWRTGDICNRAPQLTFGRAAYDPDPIGQVNRLGWYIQRTFQWLRAASSRTLLAQGDDFELPVFSPVDLSFNTVAYTESQATFEQWQHIPERFGTAEVAAVGSRQGATYVVRRFLRRTENSLMEFPWGVEIAQSKRLIAPALWVRIAELPVSDPYDAPHTWGELRQVFRAQGADLDHTLRQAFELIRDEEPHLMLLGFPIARRIGETPSQMHWQPLLLPVLSNGTKYARGFRPKSDGYWRRDRMELVRDHDLIQWQQAENWDQSEGSRRGSLPDALAARRGLFLGAGALGSVSAELLVRAGMHRMTVVDDDVLTYGNLCRHVLSMQMLGENKAQALAAHLNKLSAQAHIEAVPAKFPALSPEQRQQIADCDLAIDCTGEDETLLEMAKFPWAREMLFASISLGYRAKRLYVYTSSGSKFSADDFREQIQPWLELDAGEFGGEKLLRAEIGCWHASFPARIDEVSMLVAAAIRHLEEVVSQDADQPQLAVFEQSVTEDGFAGVLRK